MRSHFSFFSENLNWKKLILFFLTFFSTSNLICQNINQLQLGNDQDSSYYHLTKITENEYWAAGEYGIISSIDSNGNIKALNLATEGLNILKIERIDHDIFILTDNATIFKYNYLDKSIIKKTFPEFKDKCFYDMTILPHKKLLLCGGNTGISKGKHHIPKGFIAIASYNLDTLNIVWKSYRKFVWSVKEINENKFLAATFNGFNSKILVSDNGKKWSKYKSIKGLVHEINLLNGRIAYCGTGGMKYQKNGFFQIDDDKKMKFENTGCFWSMQEMDQKVLIVTQKGKFIKIDPTEKKYNIYSLPTYFPIYDVERISNEKMLMVGHGKSAFIVDIPNRN
jgi:hypothetical protein